MSTTAWPPGELGRDVDGTPITMGNRMEQAKGDTELGALRSRLGKQGKVLRRSVTRLVVRFEGKPR